MITENTPIKGELWITFNGKTDHYKNLIVTVGKNQIAAGTFSVLPTLLFNRVAVGTNATTPTIGDTALGAEVGRVTAAMNVTGNLATLTAAFPPGTGTGNIQEAGVFNNNPAGTMLSHVLVGPYNKTVTDSLSITWQFTIG